MYIKLLLTLYLLYNIRLILSCNIEEVDGVRQIDLKTCLDENIHYKYSDNGSNIYKYITCNDIDVKLIKSGEDIIWIGIGTDVIVSSINIHFRYDIMKLMSIDIKYNNEIIKNYYNNNPIHKNWLGIPFDKYLLLLNKLTNEIQFDINNDMHRTSYTESMYYENSLITATILKYEIVGCIKDRQQIIWDRNNLELSCTNIKIISQNNIRKLLELKILEHFTLNYLFFECNENNNWISINKDDYEHKCKLILNESDLDILNNTTIENKYEVVENVPIGLPSFIYLINYTLYVTKVHEGGNIIWESPNKKDRCHAIVTHLYQQQPLFAKLQIQTDNIRKDLYFYKNHRNKWILTQRYEFYQKIQDYET